MGRAEIAYDNKDSCSVVDTQNTTWFSEAPALSNGTRLPPNCDKTQSGRARGSARQVPVASIFLKTIARRLCRGAAARCGHVFDAAHQSIISDASGLNNNEQTSATYLLYSRFVSALLFIIHGGARWWAWSGPAPAHRLGSRGEPRAKLNRE